MIGNRNQKIIAIVVVGIVWLTPAILANRSLTLALIHSPNELKTWPAWPISGALFAGELLLLVVSLMMLVALGLLASKSVLNANHCIFGCVAIYSLLITLNPFLNPETGLTGLAGRIRVLSYIQSALLVSGLLWIAYSIRSLALPYLSAMLLPLVVFTIVSPLPLGLSSDYLARRAGLIEGLQLHAPQIDAASFVVAAHGDDFVVRTFTGIPSAQRCPDKNAYARIYWLLSEPSEEHPMAAESILIAKTDSAKILLVEDAILQARLRNMSQFERRQLFSNNPHVRRTFESNRSS